MVPLSSTEAETNMQMSNLADERRPMKKAVLVGLKLPPAQMTNMNSCSVDVKAQILRMKKFLMELRGFPEDKIIVIIEEDDDEDEDAKPTGKYICDHLYRLVECSYPGDILFIHLIAYGCSDGLILAPDHTHIGDTYLRGLIYRAVKLGLNLTFLSDCLVPPKPRCPCPKTPLPPLLSMEERWKILSNRKLASQATVAIGYYGFIRSTDLHHVDILTLQGDDYKTKTENNTTRLPSRVVLFTPFPSDEKVTPDNYHDVSQVVYPPPTTYKHTSYGAFTNSLLDVIEETRGAPVTNLELAQKTMLKLRGGQAPRLSCSHLNYAHAPFVC